MEALEELGAALQTWEKVQNKLLQEYELTCRLKCMLHVLFREQEEAARTARDFLAFLEESPEFKKAKSERPFVLTKLYFMNIVCCFEKEPQL
jgi:hypothetical protein